MSKNNLIESPFSNSNQRIFNDNYYYLCLVARKMMIENGSAPLFFHALYTQFLNDNIKEERNLGLQQSFKWHTLGDSKIYAIDRGISDGMVKGAEDAILKNISIYFYTALPENHEFAIQIERINKIENNKERWEAGLKLIQNTKNNLSVEDIERFENNGDLTNYTLFNLSDLNKVRQCLLEFFAPIIDDIRLLHA